MQQLFYSSKFFRWIVEYHANLTLPNKQNQTKQFELFSNECLNHQILIITKIYDLNVDNPNVKKIIQWLMLSSIWALYQKLGRVMCCEKEPVNFTLLHPIWCVNKKSGHTINLSVNHKIPKVSEKKIKANKKHNMTNNMWKFINARETKCEIFVWIVY